MPTALGRRTYYASQYKNKSLFHDKSFSPHWPLIVSHDLGSCRNFHISHVYAIKVDDSIPRYLAVEIPCGIRSPANVSYGS